MRRVTRRVHDRAVQGSGLVSTSRPYRSMRLVQAHLRLALMQSPMRRLPARASHRAFCSRPRLAQSPPGFWSGRQ